MRTQRWDLGHGLIPYVRAWDHQRHVHSQVAEGGEDTLILLEHESVYTAGKRTASWDRPTDGTPVIDVDRGGRITWHGPGQLIAYPILRLTEPVDVLAYVRALEQAVIDAVAEFGVRAERVEGRSGAWVRGDEDRKVAAIGVRVARGVTMHGVAINVCPDLQAFGTIVPCGISDAGVTSLTELTGREVSVLDCAARFEPHLRRTLAPLRRSEDLLEPRGVDHRDTTPHTPQVIG
ncbi:lipoyl(octanoyl) transferase LipB [Ruania halotolerans]|uniref:lipoyl(octanoyl) transferase LipB n=1 Tax=Ruania halotolerans TaxID=2897773 RepID=UPI001E48ECCD|nr:lipoyl(octanoyl) transferase LipB [Ruania halotolerans]UFU04852.1 lipoyl(octanoyl) transferase LipB [Ruania halotolerans]